VILLNKADLAPSSQIASIRNLISHVNPAAPVYQSVRGNVDLAKIINIGAYTSGLARERSHFTQVCCNAKDSEKGEEGHPTTHLASRGISSIQVSCPPLTVSRLERLDEWFRTVLWENRLPLLPPQDTINLQVLRCKGLFRTTDQEEYILQGVRDIYEITRIEEGHEVRDSPEGKLVLIGKGLNDKVRVSLQDVFR
jgi:G3E family GTPase